MKNPDNQMKVRPYKIQDQDSVIQLWHDCNLVVPHNDPLADIAAKLTTQPELFIVGFINGRLVGSVMAGYEGHRGAVNYLAVHPDFQGMGLGRQMMGEVEARLKALGCPKINLMVRTSNLKVMEFYKSLGFVQDEVVCLGKRL